MHLKARLLPAALVAAAVPALAAPFCAVTPEGFHFQNIRGSWKLLCLGSGEDVITWAFQGHALAVCTDATSRVKVVLQTPGKTVVRALDVRQGLAKVEAEWDDLAAGFLAAADQATPESAKGFRILMDGMVKALEAEVDAAAGYPRGDEKRAVLITRHWSLTEAALGLGELGALVTFMKDYRDLRKDSPDFFGAPRLGGLLRGSAAQLIPSGQAHPPLASLIRRLDWPFNPEAPDADRPASAVRAAAGLAAATTVDAAPEEAKEIKEVKGAGFQTPKRRHDQPLRLEDLLDDDELAELKRRAEPAAEEVPSHRVVLESLPVQEGDGAAAVRSGTRLAGPGGAPAEEKKGQ